MATKRLPALLIIMLAVRVVPAVPESKPVIREIAITIDDLPGVKTGGDRAANAIRVSRKIVRILKKHDIPALGFVNAGRTFPDDPEATERILKIWTDAGMELGNHTARHSSLHQVSVEAFKADVHDGLALLEKKMAAKGQTVRYFRHPCLHTGRTLAIRGEIDGWLGELGLTVAPVTVDNGEWIYAAAYHKTILAKDRKVKSLIVDSYLDYMERKLVYFEKQSLKLLGRDMPQIMLIHANKLNADHLDDLIERLKKRGYRFVALEKVLKDKAFELSDTYTGRGGISWLHRWAWSRGVDPKTFFTGEPEVPVEILKLAGVESE